MFIDDTELDILYENRKQALLACFPLQMLYTQQYETIKVDISTRVNGIIKDFIFLLSFVFMWCY